MGGVESAAFPRPPRPKITNVENHRPERRLEGLPAATLSLRALKKATEVMLQQPSSSEWGLK